MPFRGFTPEFPHVWCIDFLSRRAMGARKVVFETALLSALPLSGRINHSSACASVMFHRFANTFCQLLRRREGEHRNLPAAFKLLAVICIGGSAARRLINLIHRATRVPFILITKGLLRPNKKRGFVWETC